MRITEIKVQALKLMFAVRDEDVTEERLDELAGLSAYRDYLVNMNGSINRCLSDLEQKRVLPPRRYRLPSDRAERGRCTVRFDLSLLLEDFFDVCRVIRETEDAYCGSCDYRTEGDVLILTEFAEDADYTLLYFPRLPRLRDGENEDRELAGVPEELASWIPYFVKGDLYREDEPNEASEARNWYEAAMEAVERKRTEAVGNVSSVYALVRL